MSMSKDIPESSSKRRRHGKSDTVVHPPFSAPSMPKSGSGEGSGTSREQTAEEEDVVTILKAVIEFRANNNGDTPTRSTMTPLFNAIKDSLNKKLTGDQLYRKFRTLRDRYRVKFRVGPTIPFDHQFLDLSSRAWGEKEKEKKKKKNTSEEEEENNDSAKGYEKDFKLLTEEAKKHWKATGMDISLPLLELGLEFIDKKKAAPLEKKWEKHIQTGRMNIEAKTCDVKKEYLDALCGTVEEARIFLFVFYTCSLQMN